MFIKHSLDSPIGCHADRPLPKSGLGGRFDSFWLEALCLTDSGAQDSLLPRNMALAWAEVGSLLLWVGSSAGMSELAAGRKGWGHPDDGKSQLF